MPGFEWAYAIEDVFVPRGGASLYRRDEFERSLGSAESLLARSLPTQALWLNALRDRALATLAKWSALSSAERALYDERAGALAPYAGPVSWPGYNLFNAEQHGAIKAEATLSGVPQIPFREKARTISVNWKALTVAEQGAYNERAELARLDAVSRGWRPTVAHEPRDESDKWTGRYLHARACARDEPLTVAWNDLTPENRDRYDAVASDVRECSAAAYRRRRADWSARTTAGQSSGRPHRRGAPVPSPAPIDDDGSSVDAARGAVRNFFTHILAFVIADERTRRTKRARLAASA